MTAQTILWHGEKWRNQPLLATIEEFSVPVRQVPFPSVAVCPEATFVDNWAFVEKVANFFEADDKGREPLRPLLKFATSAIFDLYDDVLVENGWMAEESQRKYLKGIHGEPDVPKIANALAAIGEDQFIDVLSNANIGNAKRSGRRWVLPNIENNATISESHIKRAEQIGAIIFDLQRGRNSLLRIGYLLAHFGPVFAKSTLKSKYRPGKSKLKFNCRDIESESEKFLDAFFVNVSLSANLGDSVNVFELPMLLQPPIGNTAQFPSLRDNFPHTQCRENEGEFQIITQCFREFGYFIIGEKKIWPCDDPEAGEPVKKCCKAVALVKNLDLTKVMTIMRHANHLGSSHEKIEDILSLFDGGQIGGHPIGRKRFPDRLSKKKYTHGYDPESDFMFDFTTSLPICSFNEGSEIREFVGANRNEARMECRLFKPLPTADGLCMAFNGPRPRDVFSEGAFVEAVEAAFADHFAQGNGSVQMGRSESVFTFLLDRRALGRSDAIYDPEAVVDWGKGFRVNLGEPLDVLNSQGSFDILIPRRGYITDLFVSPLQFMASEDIRKLSLEQRNCRFNDELPENMTIFREYSQAACEMERRLKAARSRCGCTPWDSPFEGDDVRICDLFGDYCFTDVMTSVNNSDECLPDCNRLSYSFKEKEAPIDVDALCRQTEFYYTFTRVRINTNFNYFARRYSGLRILRPPLDQHKWP